MTEKASVETELVTLAERLRQDSIGSIDHAVNARAIAIESPLVRARLAEILRSGNRLTKIRPLTGYGNSLTDFRLKFEFESQSSLISMSTVDFIVSVDVPTRELRRILPGSEVNEQASVNVPFALAVPSQARELRTPLSEVASRFTRARQFLDSRILKSATREMRLMGYDPLPGSTGPTALDSAYDTPIQSTQDSWANTSTQNGGDIGNDLITDVTTETVVDTTTDWQEDIH